MGVVFHIYYLFYFIFIQDIYYTNCKEPFTKFKERYYQKEIKEKWKSITHLQLYTFHNYILYSQNSRTIAESGLFYKKLINT